VTEKLLTYALGRGLEPADIITVDRISDQLVADNGKFSTLLLALVESPAFQTRRGDDGRFKELPRVALPEPPPPEKRKGMRRGRQNAAAQVEQNVTKEPEAVTALPETKTKELPQPK